MQSQIISLLRLVIRSNYENLLFKAYDSPSEQKIKYTINLLPLSSYTA